MRADLEAIMKSWSILLGRNLHRENVLLSSLDEGANWDSNGPDLLSQLVAIEGDRDGTNAVFEK
jgi:hypothetical protein